LGRGGWTDGSQWLRFLKALFGANSFEGKIVLEDKAFHPRHPADAIRRGIGLVPESRKTEGLILRAPIYKNATLPSMRQSWLTRQSLQKQRTKPVLKSLTTKYGMPEQAVVQLSGGNQQKVVLAKWIINGARVLLLDEPSRGLDIGAKADLYNLVDKFAEGGAAVIVASSELEELYAACDAIWVFHEGRNIGKYDPSVTDRDTILRATILGENHV
jgi:ribose transport system ATP-binding protein